MNKTTRYTVKQLADIAGISKRTLHYYDEIGLLAPSSHGANRYRYYGDGDALRLQQILFFRELGFSLDEIWNLVSGSDFNVLEALQSHRRLLMGRKKRIDKMLRTVDKTVKKLKGESEMDIKEYYHGLSDADLPLPSFIKGKVRDTYDLGERLLIVATDRISAFDYVLPTAIPDKGKVLNLLSAFWFDKSRNIVANHVVEVVDDVKILDKYVPKAKQFKYPTYLSGRSMVVKKVERIAVECVARGYLAGSAWEQYQKDGSAYGIKLPKGLRQSEKLPEPIFTPTTKADAGHDEPLTFDQMKKLIGAKLAQQIKETTLAVYSMADKHASTRGIIVADTKLEYGLDGGNLILIDELLTPDSSRFWDAKKYEVGKSQPSYDKQPVRDWLTESGWNKQPPVPTLPKDIVDSTVKRYRDAYEILTGKKL